MQLIDNFNRANENPAQGFTAVGGGNNIQVLSNEAAGIAFGEPSMARSSAGPFSDNNEASIKLTVIDAGAEDVGVLLRMHESAGTFYRASIANEGGGWQIIYSRWEGGTPTSIIGPIGISRTPGAGSIFRAGIYKDVIEAFLDGVQIGEHRDSVIKTGGRVGIMIGSTTWRVDDFSGGSVGVPQPMVSSKRIVSLSPAYV